MFDSSFKPVSEGLPAIAEHVRTIFRRFSLIIFSSVILACMQLLGADETPLHQNQTAKNATPSSTAQPLSKEQIENLRAQTRLANKQAKQKKPKEIILESIPAILALAGSILAAFVAFRSLQRNTQTQLRIQQDTQFYEALKQFGDKDNPAMRAGAAAIISLWAQEHKKRFFLPALIQLLAGRRLEDNPIVVDAISDSLLPLFILNPNRALVNLQEENHHVAKSLARSLSRFLAASGAQAIESIADSLWTVVESLAEYDRKTLSWLLRKPGTGSFREFLSSNPISDELETVVKKFAGLTPADRFRQEKTYRMQLSKDAEHVRANVKLTEIVLSKLAPQPNSFAWILFNFLPGIKLHHGKGWGFTNSSLRKAVGYGAQLQETGFTYCDLSEADLRSARLNGADLTGAILDGAKLAIADLQGANLKDATLDRADLRATKFENTNVLPQALEHTDWWKADFSKQEELLEALFAKYSEAVPKFPSREWFDMHPSTHDYIKRVTGAR